MLPYSQTDPIPLEASISNCSPQTRPARDFHSSQAPSPLAATETTPQGPMHPQAPGLTNGKHHTPAIRTTNPSQQHAGQMAKPSQSTKQVPQSQRAYSTPTASTSPAKCQATESRSTTPQCSQEPSRSRPAQGPTTSTRTVSAPAHPTPAKQ